MAKVIPWMLVVVLALVAYAGWNRPAAEAPSPAQAVSQPDAQPVPVTPAAPTTPEPSRDITHCKTFHELAEVIMRSRQIGVPMVKMLEDDKDPIVRELVIRAYDKPRMSVEKNQEREITDYANDVYLACVKDSERG